MLSHWLDDRIHCFINAVVGRTLGKTSLSATSLTIASPILMIGSIYLLGSGSLFWAGCLIIFVSAFDVLDGALARANNKVTRLGAFLDSTLDRYSEIFIFFGLLLYYRQFAPDSNDILLIYVVITGSLLISYTRARAEALGFDCKVGLLERPERIILISIGLLLEWTHIALWVLAILTHVTAMQRIVHVWRQSRRQEITERSTPIV